MARWMAWMSIAALALCACGPDEGDIAIDCDDDAAVPLLVTASDEYARFVGRADEAWVFEVSTYPVALADIVASDEPWPSAIGTRVVAVDGCEAEARSVAEGAQGFLAPPPAGYPWLAVLEGPAQTSAVHRIDPIDGAPPEQITSGPSGTFLWVEDGALVIDGDIEDPSTLVLVEFAVDGGVQKTVLREGVSRLAGSADDSIVYTRVAFTTTEDQLFVRDMATGEERLVRVGATTASAYDAESRTLLISGGPGTPFRAIETDGTREIELLAGEEFTSMLSGPEFIVAVSHAGATVVESQIVWMPDLREFRASGRWLPTGESPDGAIRMLQGPDAIHRLDPDDDEPVAVRSGEGFAAVFDDRIWLLEAESVSVGLSLPPRLRLLRMQMDGSGAEDMLGRDVASVEQLDGERWIYAKELDERGLAELEAIDLATGARETLVDSVMERMAASRPSALVDDDPNDALVQRITPDDPDGNGVWIVHRDRLFR